MSHLGYDPSSPNSIYEFAKKLTGKSLSEIVDMSRVAENIANKGDLGNMVEKYFFGYEPNSSPLPDFPRAGVELKVTGVNRKKNGTYSAKERLVLTTINYMELANEEWEASSLMVKCRLMLLMFYLYEKETTVFFRRFVLEPRLFEFPENDLKQIQLDWQKIKDMVVSGRAHELSEGDTYYLAACRKGSGGIKETLKSQPNSDIRVKGRAFSLKVKYVNKIIEEALVSTSHSFHQDTPSRSPLDSTNSEPQTHKREIRISDPEPPIPKEYVGAVPTNEFKFLYSQLGIEEATRLKFDPFLGMTEEELSNALGLFKQGKNSKGFYRSIVLKVLGSKNDYAPELERAGIEIKTIRVNSNWKPYEAMSFPAFNYLEIINEKWEDSAFHEKIEQRFLFVIFRNGEDGLLRLEKVCYWNMPFLDREEARRVWEDTRRRVKVDARDLPKSSESHVAHVRPHARNSRDTNPTPQGTELVKKGFWLNQSYIREMILNLDD